MIAGCCYRASDIACCQKLSRIAEMFQAFSLHDGAVITELYNFQELATAIDSETHDILSPFNILHFFGMIKKNGK
jgi:hypothetical protein